MTDPFGRTISYLRVSVTDRCDLRCFYCMSEDMTFLPKADLLTLEELDRLCTAFIAKGVKKLRLTGGEPLLRKDLPTLVRMLAPLGADLTLTTIGSTLVKHARALRDAGLNRITVSLDSLDEATLRAMNDAEFPVTRVLEGIAAAADAGFAPIKINMVVKRGVNDHQIVDAARHWRSAGRGAGHILRFIEFMDVGSTNGWRMDDVVPSAEVLRRIAEVFPLEPVEANYGGEVAERWRYRDGAGEIGVISSVTQAFCRDCNRMRLSTEGALFTCLFAHQGHDLKSLLRGGATDLDVRDRIAAVWRQRDDRYSEIRTAETAKLRKVEMSYIGG